MQSVKNGHPALTSFPSPDNTLFIYTRTRTRKGSLPVIGGGRVAVSLLVESDEVGEVAEPALLRHFQELHIRMPHHHVLGVFQSNLHDIPLWGHAGDAGHLAT